MLVLSFIYAIVLIPSFAFLLRLFKRRPFREKRRILNRMIELVDKPVEVEGFAGDALAYVGAFLIATIGFIHLLQTSEMFDIAGYLGLLFLANFAGASVVAIVLARMNRVWVWLLGDLIAGGAFAGFVVSRLVGLPEYPVTEASWFNLPGFAALMVEGAFLSVSLLALSPRGRKLVNLEEKFIELEQAPTPLENEISIIRNRMSADLTDLKAHVSPRTLKKQAAANVQKRLPNTSKRGGIRTLVSQAAELVESHPLALVFFMAALLFAGRRVKR